MPPLRERKDDIPVLVEHFIHIFSHKYGKNAKALTQPAINKLQRYQWPGNVRELQHTIERAVILSERDIINPDDLHLNISDVSNSDLQLDDFNLENIEKMVIRKTISKHGGNLSRAAEELGLTRASLYRRLEKYGL